MARKKTRPEGIRLIGDVWYRDYVDPAGGRVRKSLKTTDRAVAEAIVKRERAQLLLCAHGIEAPDTSVGAFLRDYESAARLSNSLAYWAAIRRRLQDFFAFIRPATIARITTQDVIRWQDHCRQRFTSSGKLVASSTVRHDLASVRTGLNWAVRVGRLTKNPCDLLGNLKREAERDIDFLSEDERNLLLELCRRPIPFRARASMESTNSRPRITPLHQIVALALFAGLRLSEALHLSWTDVDFVRKELRIRSKAGFRTKNRKNRTIPLVEQLASILAPMRREEGYCFLTRNGKLYSRRNVLRELERVARRMPPRERAVNFITLRHTFATHLACKGVSIFAVSKMLGHHSVTVTERHYARFYSNGALLAQMATALAAPAPRNVGEPSPDADQCNSPPQALRNENPESHPNIVGGGV